MALDMQPNISVKRYFLIMWDFDTHFSAALYYKKGNIYCG